MEYNNVSKITILRCIIRDYYEAMCYIGLPTLKEFAARNFENLKKQFEAHNTMEEFMDGYYYI